MSFFDAATKIRIRTGRKKSGTPTLYSQPGAHTGASRKYIPGYSDANTVYLNTSTGNDGNTGASIAQALLTYSAAATAASTTKKIRLVNSATLTANITKPTEATIGTTSSIASSSLTAPVNVWTDAGTPSFSTSNIKAVCWSEGLGKFFAASESGKIAYSADGDTWAQVVSTGFGTDTITDIQWNKFFGKLIAISANAASVSSDGATWSAVNLSQMPSGEGLAEVLINRDGSAIIIGRGFIYKSTDFVSWELLTIDTSQVFESIAYAESISTYVIVAQQGVIFKSTDAANWSQAATPSFGTSNILSVCYSSTQSKFVAVGFDGKLAYSTDGETWAQASSDPFAGIINKVIWIPEIAKYVASGQSIIGYSSDGDTWTSSATPGTGVSIEDIAYSAKLGKAVSVRSSGNIAYSTAFTTTISAAVAGFSIQAVQYSGTVTAYNCTLKQPGAVAALSLDSCRITESGAHISSNGVTCTATLVEGDLHYSGTYAAANALDLNLNTISGRLFIYNASATGYERIRDNIIENGISASYAVSVLSGNIRGTNANAVLSSKVTTGQDPVFVNTTDYKLKRITDGYTADSPLVNAALYYVNEAGADRDIGAWSYDDTLNAMEYARTFYANKPSGQGYIPQNVPAANAYQGDSGEWDSYNNPSKYSEYLLIKYRDTVPVDHVDFLNYLEALTDMTCEVSVFPEDDDPATAIVVNGNHAAGDLVLNINSSATFKGGMHFTVGAYSYYAVYATPAGAVTKIVLDRPLSAAIATATSITPADVAGSGTYQFLPAKREAPSPLAQERELVAGVSFAFVRKKP